MKKKCQLMLTKKAPELDKVANLVNAITSFTQVFLLTLMHSVYNDTTKLY